MQAWQQLFPDFLAAGRPTFRRYARSLNTINYSIFLFKLPHWITVTKRELKRLKITLDDLYTQCSSQDSTLHTFLDCPVMSSMYTDILKWFNNMSSLNVIPLNEQILFHLRDKNAS